MEEGEEILLPPDWEQTGMCWKGIVENQEFTGHEPADLDFYSHTASPSLKAAGKCLSLCCPLWWSMSLYFPLQGSILAGKSCSALSCPFLPTGTRRSEPSVSFGRDQSHHEG